MIIFIKFNQNNFFLPVCTICTIVNKRINNIFFYRNVIIIRTLCICLSKRDSYYDVILFALFFSYVDDHQCNIQDDDLSFLLQREILSNIEKRKGKCIFSCPGSIERTHRSNCNSFLSEACLFVYRNHWCIAHHCIFICIPNICEKSTI